jgi:hypothetical protein
MDTLLNKDEGFVIESLSSSVGGSWRPGENPPDVYLIQGKIEVAVEISTLTQHSLPRSIFYSYSSANIYPFYTQSWH